MKSFAFSLLVVAYFFLGCFPQTAHASTPDYALMSATPYNSEIALGRERLEKFLYKANDKKTNHSGAKSRGGGSGGCLDSR